MYTYLYVCICIYIYTCYICTFVIAGSYNTCRLRHIFGHMFSFNVHSIKSSMIFLKTQVSGGFFTSQLYFTIYHAVFMGEPTHFRLGEVSCSSQTVSHYQRVTSSKVFNITFIWTPDFFTSMPQCHGAPWSSLPGRIACWDPSISMAFHVLLTGSDVLSWNCATPSILPSGVIKHGGKMPELNAGF